MSPLLVAHVRLAVAIGSEIIGTAFLQKSEQFTRPVPTVVALTLYMISIYTLTLALRGMPLGVAYAIWGGVGIAATALVGVLVFGQFLDLPAVIGIIMIVAGVVVINVFSNSVGH